MGIRDWFKPKRNETNIGLNLKVEWALLDELSETEFLFIKVSERDLQSALDSWSWLPLTNLVVFAVSAFGEVFLRNDSGEIFQIDTIEGKLSKVASSKLEFVNLLQTEDARDSLLFDGLVIAARAKGLILIEGECYDFKIAPILGGSMELEQIEKTSFAVKLDITGQIHEQVKGLADGTQIGELIIKD